MCGCHTNPRSFIVKVYFKFAILNRFVAPNCGERSEGKLNETLERGEKEGDLKRGYISLI